jgi:hypothetical protein
VVTANKLSCYDGCISSPSVHGQSVRKIFSQEKPLIVSKVALNVKTSEVYDIRETDPEDESQSVADIQIMEDCQALFQPSRRLAVTPPPLSDPEGPVSRHSVNAVELTETLFHQLPSGVTVRAPSPPPTEPAIMSDETS